MIKLLGGLHFAPQYWLFTKNEVRSRQGVTFAPGLSFSLSLALPHVKFCVWACSSWWESKKEGWEEFIILLNYSIS